MSSFDAFMISYRVRRNPLLTKEELNKMTVADLRKLAKEMKVTLGAGVQKATIVDKIAAAFPAEESAPAPVQQQL